MPDNTYQRNILEGLKPAVNARRTREIIEQARNDTRSNKKREKKPNTRVTIRITSINIYLLSYTPLYQL